VRPRITVYLSEGQLDYLRREAAKRRRSGIGLKHIKEQWCAFRAPMFQSPPHRGSV